MVEYIMRTTYDEADDILELHLSEKPICKETSQDWNTHISYAEDGHRPRPQGLCTLA